MTPKKNGPGNGSNRETKKTNNPKPVLTGISTKNSSGNVLPNIPTVENGEGEAASKSQPKKTKPIPTTEKPRAKDQGLSDISQRWVKAHNYFRQLYSVSDVQWNETLAAAAQVETDKCLFEHSAGPYGENIAAGYPDLESVVKDWVSAPDECHSYNPANPIYSHFTQVVWDNTRQIGCAITNCPNLRHTDLRDTPFSACEYDPPGNYIGEFTENVHAKFNDCRTQ